MKKITQVSKAMQEILDQKANKIADNHPFFERQRKVTGSSLVRGLVFGWMGDPDASLSTLSQSIGNAGTPITRQGVHQRLTYEGASYLKAVLTESLKQMVKAIPMQAGLLAKFEHVYLLDSTQVELPDELQDHWLGSGGYVKGKQSAAMKVNVRWDVRNGALCDLDLSNGRQNDGKSSIQTAPMSKGSLRIADLGYFSLDVLKQIGDEEAFFLTRYKQGTKVFHPDGQELDLAQALPQTVGERVDWQVHLGQTAQLPCRLIAERVPQHVVQQRHDTLDEMARRRQTTISDRAYEMAQWSIYVTNVPQAMLSIDDILALGRYRWQIELLFKLWKSDLALDKWRSLKPERILCELYAKLIGVIVTHWLLLVGTWHHPHRSLRRAMATIRGLAWQFANSLTSTLLLDHVISALIRSLETCRLEQSTTFQPSSKVVQIA